jgi:hypothetical protein
VVETGGLIDAVSLATQSSDSLSDGKERKGKEKGKVVTGGVETWLRDQSACSEECLGRRDN